MQHEPSTSGVQVFQHVEQLHLLPTQSIAIPLSYDMRGAITQCMHVIGRLCLLLIKSTMQLFM